MKLHTSPNAGRQQLPRAFLPLSQKPRFCERRTASPSTNRKRHTCAQSERTGQSCIRRPRAIRGQVHRPRTESGIPEPNPKGQVRAEYVAMRRSVDRFNVHEQKVAWLSRIRKGRSERHTSPCGDPWTGSTSTNRSIPVPNPKGRVRAANVAPGRSVDRFTVHEASAPPARCSSKRTRPRRCFPRPRPSHADRSARGPFEPAPR